jgi:hypothetical protein
MTRLVHVIADYGAGDLAFGELMQRLELVLPDLDLQHTRVAPGDTLAAGYCVARLALTPGPAGRLVLHDVAGPGRELERLCVGRTLDGVLVAGRDAGWCWSFVIDALRGIWVLDVPARARPRDPADAMPKAVVRVLAGHGHALRDRLPRSAVPPYPSCAVAYVDGHGNLETTITGLPAPPGSRVLVRIGEVSAPATVAEANGAVAPGELVLAPISPGWRARSSAQRPHMEVAVRGGSAAQRFGEPRPGAPISLLPVDPPWRPPVPGTPRRDAAARHVPLRS